MSAKIPGSKKLDLAIQSRLLKANEAAKYLSISGKTLWLWTTNGSLPVVKIGPNARVKYDRKDLDRIIEESKSYNQSYLALQKIKGQMTGGQL